MPHARINGQNIYFEDSGGAGTPMVFSHGLLMDHEMFVPQVDAFRSQHRVVTWDERCHGKTETTSDPFTYWDSAEDLHGLLAHLGIDRAIVGGMSQGGFLSLRFAIKHPEKVAGLILIDTQAGIEDPDKAGTYEVMLDVWEADGMTDQMGEAIAATILGNEWPGRAPWIEKWRHASPKMMRLAFSTLVGREDIHDRLGEIKVPALVIHGTADTAIDMELAQRLCSELAECRRLVPVEGGGHAANLTHPKPVNEAIKQFVRELVPTA